MRYSRSGHLDSLRRLSGQTLGAALAIGLTIALASPLLAERPAKKSSSQETDLHVPRTGVVRQGQGKRVTVSDGDGDDLVALLHVEVGDRRLIILPDGRLDSVPLSFAKETDEAFRPATKEAIATDLKSKGFRDFKSRSTARYVYVYNCSEEFQKGTSRILETMYPAILQYFKRLKIPVHDPSVPLVAVMFRTEDQFRKYDPVPAGVAAYYSPITNRIVMYEQSELVEIAPELAVKQSIGVIAHEGIHQILHNIGVQQRLARWPMWTSEGLAEYFAPTSVDKRLRWKGVGHPHDMRMYELHEALKRPRTTPGRYVEETVGAARLTSTGYAWAWGLTHYLASRKKEKFQGYLREVARLEPLEPRDPQQAIAAHKELFVKFFGDDYAAIEDSLVAHLEDLPYVDPIANQTHYVVMLKSPSRRQASVTTSPAAVQRWQEEAVTQIPADLRAQMSFEILSFADRDSARQFAQQWLRSH